MRKTVLIILILTGTSFICFSQTAMKTHNYYFYYDKKVTKPTITISTMTKIHKKLYFSTYTIVRPSWGQAVMGFDVAATDWMILGFKAGIQTETNGTMGRYSPIIYIQKNNWNIFGVYEWGGYRDRSQGLLCYRLGNFNPGIMEAHNGDLVAIGPMLEYTIPKTVFTFYGSAMTVLKDGKFASQFGLYIKFLPKEADKYEKMETSMFYDMPDYRPIP